MIIMVISRRGVYERLVACESQPTNKLSQQLVRACNSNISRPIMSVLDSLAQAGHERRFAIQTSCNFVSRPNKFDIYFVMFCRLSFLSSVWRARVMKTIAFFAMRTRPRKTPPEKRRLFPVFSGRFSRV